MTGNSDIAYHEEQQCSANGILINYDSFGDPCDPPVILVMGLATQLVHWDPEFCKRLAQRGFFVVRFDNRDIGKSEKMHHLPTPNRLSIVGSHFIGTRTRPVYSLDDMAADVLGLMDHLNILSAHLVGVSMGGMIAQCITLRAPERVLSLTSIMSTTGNRRLPKPSTKTAMLLASPTPKNEDAYVRHGTELWRHLHGEYYQFDIERIQSLLRLSFHRSCYPRGILRQLSAIIGAPDRTPSLSSVACPTLVIHGGSDPLVHVDCGKATANAIEHSVLRIYDHMGHTLPRELWGDMIDDICGVTTIKASLG